MTLAIRSARPDDLAAVRACAEEAYAPYIPLIGRRPAPMDADFAAQITAGRIDVAVAQTGDLLGYLVCFPESGAMFLESVAVFNKAAGQGIGKALICHCERAASAQGLVTIRLYTNARMTRNIGLYRHLGYTQTARRFEAGFDRIYFEKSLPATRPSR